MRPPTKREQLQHKLERLAQALNRGVHDHIPHPDDSQQGDLYFHKDIQGFCVYEVSGNGAEYFSPCLSLSEMNLWLDGAIKGAYGRVKEVTR